MSFAVNVRSAPACPYESVTREVASNELDAFVRDSIAHLEQQHEAAGQPFALYMGCDKDDAQLVEVCLPTESGTKVLPAADLAYTAEPTLVSTRSAETSGRPAKPTTVEAREPSSRAFSAKRRTETRAKAPAFARS